MTGVNPDSPFPIVATPEQNLAGLAQATAGLLRLPGADKVSPPDSLDSICRTVRAFATAVDDLDPYTRGHSLRVVRYASLLGRALFLSRRELVRLEFGALVHDTGKIMIPRSVLHKVGRLTAAEWEVMKQHPEMGARLIERVEFLCATAPIVRHHHERWDGNGYPDNLAGEAIPLLARLVTVADVFDALTSQRSYREAYTPQQALAEMKKMAGYHLDPYLVAVFCTASLSAIPFSKGDEL